MSPQQALQLLDQMVMSMRLTRVEHHNAVQAVQTLSAVIDGPRAPAAAAAAPAAVKPDLKPVTQ